MRSEAAVVVDSAAESGSEREHDFEAFALDDCGALNLGVVEDAGRPLECRGQDRLGIPVAPCLDEARVLPCTDPRRLGSAVFG